MSGHTKEPWKFSDVLGGCFVRAGSREVLRYSHSPDAENKANARRIVACVNYCAGLDTEGMETAVQIERPARKTIDESLEKQLILTGQRDELLEALERVIARPIGVATEVRNELQHVIASVKGGVVL